MAEVKARNKNMPDVLGGSGIVKFLEAKDFNLTDVSSKNRSLVRNFAQAIRVLMQNWRQGTVACKGRGDLVSRSTRKPWKQKGTGRARAGSARSPLWRGGGVIFGPQKRVKTLKINQKSRKSLFQSLIWERLNAQRVLEIDWMPSEESPKTSAAYKVLKNAGVSDKKIALFVSSYDNQSVLISFANLPNVHMLLCDHPNVYALAHSDYWIVLKQNSDSFKEMVSAWI